MLLVTVVVSAESDMKATKQDPSHSHTPIQSGPGPDKMLRLRHGDMRHINYIIVREARGHCAFKCVQKTKGNLILSSFKIKDNLLYPK